MAVTTPIEMTLRAASHLTDRVRTLPILALSVHSACNCRCVMCDIWKANADKRDITAGDLERHMPAIRALRVQRVMLTGGEPLLHRNLWALADRLRGDGIAVTLVTTGLLLDAHADAIAGAVDELVVSIDGPPDVHDAIRRVAGGFDRIGRGLAAVATREPRPRVTARCVVQRANHRHLVAATEAVRRLPVDRLSFLAADVSSTAFNRPTPWTEDRQSEIALSRTELTDLETSIRDVGAQCADAIESGFLVGGMQPLWQIYDYYCALAGLRGFPRVRCNAPWVSAVMEPGGRLRPCFFHELYPPESDLASTINSAAARTFRRGLDVSTHPVCQRCVCTLHLPLWRAV
jgi:MoaA/NifB/PqqE/SkfB family radical SAM enzyme